MESESEEASGVGGPDRPEEASAAPSSPQPSASAAAKTPEPSEAAARFQPEVEANLKAAGRFTATVPPPPPPPSSSRFLET